MKTRVCREGAACVSAMMAGKTTRYCAKCRRMLTRISLSEFNEHAAVCEGPDKVQDKKQLKKPAPRAAPPPRVRARDLRAAKAVPAAPAAPPAGGRAPPQQQQQAYVPPPLPVHPRLTPHLEKYAEGPSQFCGLVLERSHMSEAVLETYENPDLVKELEDVTADELLELQKKCDWSDGILDRWYGWGGENGICASYHLTRCRFQGVSDGRRHGRAAQNCG